jgi:hypothetical protein
MHTTETNDRDITERLQKNDHDASARRESVTTNTAIDHTGDTRTGEVGPLRVRTRIA